MVNRSVDGEGRLRVGTTFFSWIRVRWSSLVDWLGVRRARVGWFGITSWPV
jgi:hypothetical protein